MKAPLYRNHTPPKLQQEIDRLYRELHRLGSIVVEEEEVQPPPGPTPNATNPGLVGFWFVWIDSEKMRFGTPPHLHEYAWPLVTFPAGSTYVLLDATMHLLSDASGSVGFASDSDVEWLIQSSTASIPSSYWEGGDTHFRPKFWRWHNKDAAAPIAFTNDGDANGGHVGKHIQLLADEADDTIMLYLHKEEPGELLCLRGAAWGRYVLIKGTHRFASKCPIR